LGEKGVHVHQEKIQAIIGWTTHKTITELKDFLGICSYNINFFKGFSQLCAPLTDITSKGEFNWNDEAHVTFKRINKVMSTFHLLSLPDFSQPFILKCDASGEGVGACLMQNRHPISYESHKLRGPELLYTIYDK
jgi:hypothetical protein